MSESIVWHDAEDIGVEGKGWEDTAGYYDRLPSKAEAMVREPVWRMSHDPTGMCLRFRTNASEIHARWALIKAQLGEANFNRCADSGLDLYGRDAGEWRWVATTHCFDGQSPEVCIVEGLDGVERDYLLYLPLRNAPTSLEVGVPTKAKCEPLSPRKDKPMVFYGTSIVHGAYASRAGLVYPSILGRRLNRPVINLGFSGNARMDLEVAGLLGEIDAAVYVLDPMPNMTLELVDERAEKFIRKLRDARPDVPIVLVEDFPRTNSWVIPEKEQSVSEKTERYREIVEGLVADGVSGLHFVEGFDLIGTDCEASIDGIHPGDIGMLRIADRMEHVLASALSQA